MLLDIARRLFGYTSVWILFKMLRRQFGYTSVRILFKMLYSTVWLLASSLDTPPYTVLRFSYRLEFGYSPFVTSSVPFLVRIQFVHDFSSPFCSSNTVHSLLLRSLSFLRIQYICTDQIHLSPRGLRSTIWGKKVLPLYKINCTHSGELYAKYLCRTHLLRKIRRQLKIWKA